MKKRIPLVIALFSTTFLVLPAFAYQFEIEAEYSDSETDYDGSYSPDTDEDSFSISGTYYFTDVATNKGPLSVAAFLDRASSISAFYSDGEIEVEEQQFLSSSFGPPLLGAYYGVYFFPKYEIDTEEYSINGQYIHPESGWLVEASYGYVGEDSDLGIDTEQDVYGVGVGKYIAQNTRLMLDYIHIETDIDLGSTDTSSDSELVNLGLFHVQELGSGTYYDVSLDVAHIDPDDGDDSQAYSIGATYYFTSNIGLGFDVSHVDSDDVDTTSYGVSGEWFITDNFSISLNYVRTDIDIDIELPSFTPGPYRGIDFTSSTVFEDSSNDADIDAFTIGARLRF